MDNMVLTPNSMEELPTLPTTSMPEAKEEEKNPTAEEATKEFFGYIVEVDCGEEGSYKGIITEVEPADNGSSTWGKIKLEKPSRNDVSIGGEDGEIAVLIPGELIQDIKVLDMPIPSPKPHGTVSVKKVLHRIGRPSILMRPSSSMRAHPVKTAKAVHMTGTQFLNRFNPLPNPVTFPMRGGTVPSPPVKLLQRDKKVLNITTPPQKGNAQAINKERRESDKSKGKEERKPRKSQEDDRFIVEVWRGGKPQHSGKSLAKKDKPIETKEVAPGQMKILQRNIDSVKQQSSSQTGKPSDLESTSSKQSQGRTIYNSSMRPSNKQMRAGASQFSVTSSGRTSISNVRPSVAQSLLRSSNSPVTVMTHQIRAEPKKTIFNPNSVPFQPRLSQPQQQHQKAKKILSITPPPSDEQMEQVKEQEKVLNKLDTEVKVPAVKTDAGSAKQQKQKNRNPSTSKEEKKASKTEKLDQAKKVTVKEERNRLEKVKRAAKKEESKQSKKKLEEEEEKPQSKEDAKETSEDDKSRLEIAEILEKAIADISKVDINDQVDIDDSNVNVSAPIQAQSASGSSTAKPSLESYVGSLASITCDDSMVYQGVIDAIDGNERTVTLEKTMLNGRPLSQPSIVLSCEQMKDIKIFGDEGRNQNRNFHNTRDGGAHRQQQRNMQPGGSIFMQSSPRPQTPPTPRRFGGGGGVGSSSPECQYGPRTFVRRTPPSTPPAQLAHEEYGEYKKFKEPQVPIPMRLRMNPRRNLNQNVHGMGPTGMPAVDCRNGYRGYNNSLNNTEDTMGDPFDHDTMNTDFDFAGNLALFDKKEFVRQTDRIFHGLDTGGDNSRNFRNDENDSSRVISWTNGGRQSAGDSQQKNYGKKRGFNSPTPPRK